MTDHWAGLAEEILAALRTLRHDERRLQQRRKADGSLVTGADIAMQELVVRHIRAIDSSACIVAEEGSDLQTTSDSGEVWIIDPIDGTSQFASPTASEYCCSMALLSSGVPVGALVVAPELGPRGSALTFEVHDGVATLNGDVVSAAQARTRNGSATGSLGRRLPLSLEIAGETYTLKRQATSQTIDLLRTCISFDAYDGRPGYDFFARENQWLWDGAPGLAFAAALGLSIENFEGDDLIPIHADSIDRRRIPSTIVRRSHTAAPTFSARN
jgi:3'(2'), 5'-bisphosphate nucleotidase